MFRAILDTQWKVSRWGVLFATVLCFAAPLYSMQLARSTQNAFSFIAIMQQWSVIYATLAAALGLGVAVMAWSPDHRGDHVYALVLPVARWRYVLLRFAAGLVIMMPAVVALGAGALFVAVSPGVPEGLHTYALALTARFALAALVAYAIFFSIASATARTAGWVLGTIGGLIAVQILASAAGWDVNVLGRASEFVLSSPGLLAVFSGRWMLIDV